MKEQQPTALPAAEETATLKAADAVATQERPEDLPLMNFGNCPMNVRGRFCRQPIGPPNFHGRQQCARGHVVPALKFKPARNGYCPCGSGRKWKRCCQPGFEQKRVEARAAAALARERLVVPAGSAGRLSNSLAVALAVAGAPPPSTT